MCGRVLTASCTSSPKKITPRCCGWNRQRCQLGRESTATQPSTALDDFSCSGTNKNVRIAPAYDGGHQPLSMSSKAGKRFWNHDEVKFHAQQCIQQRARIVCREQSG